MAKQIEDTKTLDLLPTPKKRGRPSTGTAKTAAERKREQKARDLAKLHQTDVRAALPHLTLQGLTDELRAATREGRIHLAQGICDEIMRRARAADASHIEGPDPR